MSYTISIVLDRRGKVKAEKDKCPVKLRIFSRIHKKDKRYNISIHLTKQEFEIIWINPKNKKLRGKNKEIYLKLIEFEKRANDVADAMTFFDFAKFEMKLFRKSTDNNLSLIHI